MQKGEEVTGTYGISHCVCDSKAALVSSLACNRCPWAHREQESRNNAHGVFSEQQQGRGLHLNELFHVWPGLGSTHRRCRALRPAAASCCCFLPTWPPQQAQRLQTLSPPKKRISKPSDLTCSLCSPHISFPALTHPWSTPLGAAAQRETRVGFSCPSCSCPGNRNLPSQLPAQQLSLGRKYDAFTH